MTRVLVAGVGNVFLGDDGFGVEVARRLATSDLGPGVRVADFGIRALHLAYDLMDHPVDLLVLVDATARGGAPGTLYVIEFEMGPGSVAADAHSITPDAVLGTLRALGGSVDRVRIVGCEPASLDEGMELSSTVGSVVDEAVRMVRDLVLEEVG